MSCPPMKPENMERFLAHMEQADELLAFHFGPKHHMRERLLEKIELVRAQLLNTKVEL